MKSLLSGTRGFTVTLANFTLVYINKDMVRSIKAISVENQPETNTVINLGSGDKFVYANEEYEEVVERFES